MTTTPTTISLRKAAELCGLPLTTLHRFAKKHGTPSDKSKGLSAEQLLRAAHHYAKQNHTAALLLAYAVSCNDFTLASLESPEFRAFMADGGKKRKPKDTSGYIYIVKCEGYYKIGKTNKADAAERVAALQTGNPFELVVLRTRYVKNAFKSEAYLHYKFSKCHHRGEWFEFSAMELEELLEALASLA